MKQEVTIIVPVFNEKETVLQTLQDLCSHLTHSRISFEMIVVDDGSDDGSADAIKKIDHPGLRIITHEKNLGYGAAIKSGIRQSAHDILAITDADGTYPHDRIPELLHAIEDHDMVVGARTGQTVKIPLVRRPAKWIINRLAEYLSEKTIPDLNSGLRVMRKDVLMRFFRLLPDGFSLTTTITLALIKNGYRIRYIPIDYHPRKGRSKIRPVRDTLNFVQLIIRNVMYFEPLKVFVPASMLLFVSSILALLYRIIFRGGLMVISILLFLSAIQMLATGMLADLILKRDDLK